MPEIKPDIETFAKIRVMGVGGAGNSVVNRMVDARIKGVEFIAVNTDVQALYHSKAPTKLHIGKTVTRGLGAGMNPDLGRQAAEESQNELRELIKGTDMLFITCGCGGGTGSGASPYIANIAKEMGILTVGVVTKPFTFEGVQRMNIALKCIENLEDRLDTLITIPNDKILQLVDKKTSLLEAFSFADEILRQGIQGISELITIPGLINVDFADVKSIMRDAGSALMGVGIAVGENRAIEAAKQAIESPLLELSIDGAKGVLFTIAGGSNLSMHEVSEAAGIVTASVDSNARIIFGAIVDDSLGDELRITVIATDFAHSTKVKSEPKNMTTASVLSGQVYTPPQNRPFSVLLGQKKEAEPVNNSNNSNNINQQQEDSLSVGFQTSAGYAQQNSSNSDIFSRKKFESDTHDNNGSHHQSMKNQRSQQRDSQVSQPQQQSYNSNNNRPVDDQPQFTKHDVTSNQDDEDLEIPAFIRRQMQS